MNNIYKQQVREKTQKNKYKEGKKSTQSKSVIEETFKQENKNAQNLIRTESKDMRQKVR